MNSELIFNRGLELLDDNTHKNLESVETRFEFDEVDSRQKVREIATQLKNIGKWDYFITLTVNDKETPGMKQISEAMETVAGGNTQKEADLYHANMMLMNRSWSRIVDNIMHWIINSKEQPIGKVRGYFWRFEFQEQKGQSAGFKPHVHAGFTLFPEPEEVTVNRICARSDELFCSGYGTDVYELVEKGLARNYHDAFRLKGLLERIGQHNCDKAGGRCHKRVDAEGNTVCRFPKARKCSEVHKEFYDSCFNADKERCLLEQLGLMGRVPEEERKHMYDDDWWYAKKLQAYRWKYRVDGEEHFSPTIPILSALMVSMVNVQVPDERFCLAYLIKYLGGEEERPTATLKGTKNAENVCVEVENHQHLKITSQKLIRRGGDDKKKALSCRVMGLPEMFWSMAGLQFFRTSSKFRHINTQPPECRSAIFRKRCIREINFGARGNSDEVIDRRSLSDAVPEWRKFTQSQKIHFEQRASTNFRLDSMDHFNMRPPELHVFQSVLFFHEFFVLSYENDRKKRFIIEKEIEDQPWISASGHRVKIRLVAIEKACAYLLSRLDSENSSCLPEVKEVHDRIFARLKELGRDFRRGSLTNADSKFFARFVDTTESIETFPVLGNVSPKYREKFWYHCLGFNFRTNIRY